MHSDFSFIRLSLVMTRQVRLPYSGFYTIRGGPPGADATMISLRCGPSYNAHSHKDAASFELASRQRMLLSDSGCYTCVARMNPPTLGYAHTHAHSHAHMHTYTHTHTHTSAHSTLFECQFLTWAKGVVAHVCKQATTISTQQLQPVFSLALRVENCDTVCYVFDDCLAD